MSTAEAESMAWSTQVTRTTPYGGMGSGRTEADKGETGTSLWSLWESQGGLLSGNLEPPSILNPWCYTPPRILPATAKQVPGTGSTGGCYEP
jgi:hypothetical protein